MCALDLVSELSPFVYWPRAFRESELFDLLHADVSHGTFHSTLAADRRFIALDGEGERYYILDSTLFHWFARLNVRLARAQRCSLRRGQLARLLGSLVLGGQAVLATDTAVRWADSVGLATASCRPGEYAFPLARMLSFLSPPSLALSEHILKEIAGRRMWAPPLDGAVNRLILEGLCRFPEKVVAVVRSREALDTERRVTLAELGERLRVSRERVRQLESKFWRAVRTGRGFGTVAERQRRVMPGNFDLPPGLVRNRYSVPFIRALLLDFFNHRGDLMFSTTSPKARLRRFLGKCAGIPIADLGHFGLSVLAASTEAFQLQGLVKEFPDSICPRSIAARLAQDEHLTLTARESERYAERLAAYNRSRLDKYQRIYLALRHIGRPAHYSEVAETHNFLFPERASSEHSIHAALNQQRCGIVWAGTRGTFALREWGFERPQRSLFDAVSTIVERAYQQTGNPVPFSFIVAEIGKHRQLVKQSSLMIAAHCNPSLRRVGRDSFVPRRSEDESLEDASAEELDRILREFEEGG